MENDDTSLPLIDFVEILHTDNSLNEFIKIYLNNIHNKKIIINLKESLFKENKINFNNSYQKEKFSNLIDQVLRSFNDFYTPLIDINGKFEEDWLILYIKSLLENKLNTDFVNKLKECFPLSLFKDMQELDRFSKNVIAWKKSILGDDESEDKKNILTIRKIFSLDYIEIRSLSEILKSNLLKIFQFQDQSNLSFDNEFYSDLSKKCDYLIKVICLLIKIMRIVSIRDLSKDLIDSSRVFFGFSNQITIQQYEKFENLIFSLILNAINDNEFWVKRYLEYGKVIDYLNDTININLDKQDKVKVNITSEEKDKLKDIFNEKVYVRCKLDNISNLGNFYFKKKYSDKLLVIINKFIIKKISNLFDAEYHEKKSFDDNQILISSFQKTQVVDRREKTKSLPEEEIALALKFKKNKEISLKENLDKIFNFSPEEMLSIISEWSILTNQIGRQAETAPIISNKNAVFANTRTQSEYPLSKANTVLKQ